MRELLPERLRDLQELQLSEALSEIERYMNYMAERLELLNKEFNKLKNTVENGGQT